MMNETQKNRQEHGRHATYVNDGAGALTPPLRAGRGGAGGVPRRNNPRRALAFLLSLAVILNIAMPQSALLAYGSSTPSAIVEADEGGGAPIDEPEPEPSKAADTVTQNDKNADTVARNDKNVEISTRGGVAAFSEMTPMDAPSDVSHIYVSSEGNDSAGDGTWGKPYLTIQHAVDEASANANIYLMTDIVQGETVTIIKDATKNITLRKSPDIPDDRAITVLRYRNMANEENSFKGNLFSVLPGSTLTVEGIVIDGNHTPNSSAAVSLYGYLHLTGAAIRNNVSKEDGGGVRVDGAAAAFLVTNSEISGNTSAGNGSAVYFNSGAFGVAGTPKIGLDENDNGIYVAAEKVMTIRGELGEGSRVNIDRKANVTVGSRIAVKEDGSPAPTTAEAVFLYWRTIAYNIAGGTGANARAYVLELGETDFYVANAGHNGSDVVGNGSFSKPFATITKAFLELPQSPIGQDPISTTVSLKSDINFNAVASLNVGDVTVKRWAEAADPVRAVRAIGYTASCITVGTNAKVTLEDVIYDGNAANVDQCASLIAINGGTLVMKSGKITNNIATGYGGGVYLAGNGTFTMTGGEVSGNQTYESENGGHDLYFYNGTFNIEGNPQVGTGILDRGCFMGPNSVITVTGDLDPSSHIFIEGKMNAAKGTVIATKNLEEVGTVSSSESRRLSWMPVGRKVVADAGNNNYVLDDSYDLYVATYGSDTQGTGSLSNPFKTISHAFGLAVGKPSPNASVIVMDDMAMSAPLTVPAEKHITISQWEDTDAIVTVSRGTVSGNLFTVNGNGSLTIHNLILDGNRTEFVANNASLVHLNANVANATATFTLEPGGILRNNKGSNGGAVSAVSETANGGKAVFNMTGGEITGNTATNGGAVYLNANAADRSATFNMTGGKIADNEAATNGGGIYAGPYTSVNLDVVSIERNEAGDSGGGIYAGSNTSVKLVTASIKQNTAANAGGGLYSGGASSVEGNSFIKENSAKFGAGIYYGGTTLTLKGNIRIGQSDTDNGIYIMSGKDIKQQGDLGPDARVNVELKAGNAAVNEIIVTKSVSSTNDSEAERYFYQYPQYSIGKGSNTTYILKVSADFYVASNGNDATGYGTIDAPFATINKAVSTAAPNQPTIVRVMDNISMGSTLTIPNAKDITVMTSEGAIGGTATVSRAAAGNLFIVDAGGALTFDNIIADGVKAVYSGYSFVSLNVPSGSKAFFTMKNGAVIRNNKATNGGAISVIGASASFSMLSGALYGNEAIGGALNGNGGGVYAMNGAYVELPGDRIENNTAIHGGGIYAGTSVEISLSGVAIKGNTATGLDSAGNGGGIYFSGSKLTVTGETLIAANNATTGRAVYYNAGTMTLAGNVRIGENNADNGIYIPSSSLTISQFGALGADAHVNVERKVGASTDDVVARRNDNGATDEEAGKYFYQTAPHHIVKKGEDSYALGIISEFYVSNLLGDDVNGYGTIDSPFKTVERAVTVATADNATTIRVMDNVRMSAQASIANGKDITIKTSEGAIGAPVTVSRDSANIALFNVGSGGKLTLENIIADGEKVVYPNNTSPLINVNAP
ncbi:MAG: hypothetical protein LBL63_03245, partial [Clostridiales Family XIII bacterium]|nr:hypothetical protein [Clostridiales Family XIII bacterium]